MQNENKTPLTYIKGITKVFFITIAIFLTLMIIIKDKTFSENENRNLKTFPKINFTDYKNGKLSKDLESYMVDQFVFRDLFISLKSIGEKLTLRKEINDVYINNKNRLIAKFKMNNEGLTNEKVDSINKFIKATPNINHTFMLVPNKVEIYKEELPFKNTENSQSAYIKKFYSKLDPQINKVDVTEDLLKQKDNKDKEIYFKTDHHWTQFGAFTAYKSYRNKIEKKDVLESEFDVRKVTNDFYGTLSSKTGIYGEKDSLGLYNYKDNFNYLVNIVSDKQKKPVYYDLEKLKGKDKYLVFFGGNYDLVRIQTVSTNKRKLLVIKDSYANSFVPFMIKDYGEITVVDLRYFNSNIYNVIKDYNITDCLFLYNVNTFNDDNSILNLKDYLNKDGSIIEEKQ